MSAPTTVPVSLTPEAAERLEELGMHAELERMVEYTRQTAPGLFAIHVALRPMYDTHESTGILLEALVDENYYAPNDPVWRDWGAWLYTTFPPQVVEHFQVWAVPGKTHEG